MLKLVKGVEKKNHNLLTTLSERRGEARRQWCTECVCVRSQEADTRPYNNVTTKATTELIQFHDTKRNNFVGGFGYRLLTKVKRKENNINFGVTPFLREETTS